MEIMYIDRTALYIVRLMEITRNIGKSSLIITKLELMIAKFDN